jgi:hypothetical protein
MPAEKSIDHNCFIGFHNLSKNTKYKYAIAAPAKAAIFVWPLLKITYTVLK